MEGSGVGGRSPSLCLCVCSMGYMEMKRVSQELALEVQSLRESSESREVKHVEAINQLALEIAEHKVHIFVNSKLDKIVVIPETTRRNEE